MAYPPPAGYPYGAPPAYAQQPGGYTPSTSYPAPNIYAAPNVYAPPPNVYAPQGTYSSAQPSNVYAAPIAYAPPSNVYAPPPNVYGAPPPNIYAPASSVYASPSPGISRGTIRPTYAHNPSQDAEILRRAMKGFGTDEAAVIGVICRRTNQELRQVELTYKTLFGRDLRNDLQSETSGKFRDVIMARLMSPAEYDAWSLHEAISGFGTDEMALIEILTTRTNQEIRNIRLAYRQLYGKEVEQETQGDTSGDFRRLLTSLLQGNRDESGRIDISGAGADAQGLYRAGEGRWGTDEAVFNSILCSRGFPQLNAIFREYSRISGHEFETALQKEMSGDLRNGLLAIVKVARNKADFLAERAYASMKGLGTKDTTLVRIICSRCEIDLQDIKEIFVAKYRIPLARMIESDTSGDYRHALVTIVGN